MSSPLRAINKRLTLLSEAERSALYSLPDFDEEQRVEYLTLTQEEQTLMYGRSNASNQLYCALQIGYFKAKQTFFSFTWVDVAAEDIDWVVKQYLPGYSLPHRPITAYEYYQQREAIMRLFGYQLWSKHSHCLLQTKANQLVKRDTTPSFILTKLIAVLLEQKIVRPGYTTLQATISHALVSERKRLGNQIYQGLNLEGQAAFKRLLVHEKSLSELASVKQDAKNFGFIMMALERKKLATLAPLYPIAKALLPQLGISQQNLHYYASLVHYYTIYDLRRLKPEQSYLYLLCYVWQRYQQLTDNLVEAFCYQLKQFEDDIQSKLKEALFQHQTRHQHESFAIGRLLQLFVNEQISDETPYGEVRQQAFAIMPKKMLSHTADRLSAKPISALTLRWQIIDKEHHRFKKHLRPLALLLVFNSTLTPNPWLAALQWFKQVFSCQQSLKQRPFEEHPEASIPQRLRPYLIINPQSESPSLHTQRYEFWIYQQLGKRLNTGELYLEDSIKHRCFNQELLPLPQNSDDPTQNNTLLQQLNIPGLQQPLEEQLDTLSVQLHDLWIAFDNKLRQGQLKHLKYTPDNKRVLSWLKPKKSHSDEEIQRSFYAQLACCNIIDVLQFVDDQCHFLSAFTHLTPRYAKTAADRSNLLAVIIAQAMNHGNFRMAESSDVSYHILEATYAQYLRLSTLQAANDVISNAISKLDIFPYYSFDLEVLYGCVDGQKYEIEYPTTKARYSRKYFGKGKGVVAYTLLANHVPLQTLLIGAHEHESYFVFDIWHQNTSAIEPTVITGDMHCINKANFAFMHWFGPQLRPRFTDPQAQLKHLYCPYDLACYRHCLIQPVGTINRQLILDEKLNIQRILLTLGLKEITQSTLIKKLCTYTHQNPTRRALFEYDKLIRSIYTLTYLMDPQLHRNVHRSQNRIEEYHHLRAAIAQAGGKKQLTGKTDLEIAISNQCGRLVANAIIYYNSFLFSKLLQKYSDPHRQKSLLALFAKISPVAWQHIHFLGYFSFCNNICSINIDAILADFVL